MARWSDILIVLVSAPARKKENPMHTFALPPAIRDLVNARNKVREYYLDALTRQGSGVALKFTLDGNLVGDIGEAMAVELFGVRLVETSATEGIDGFEPQGNRTVQVKATGTGRGPAFRQTEMRADHLLFFDLDFENASGTVLFNGPEHYAFDLLRKPFSGQRSLSRNQIIRAADRVQPHEMLPLLDLSSQDR